MVEAIARGIDRDRSLDFLWGIAEGPLKVLLRRERSPGDHHARKQYNEHAAQGKRSAADWPYWFVKSHIAT